jgi:D-3-phosphoglycerate dehydrogenase
LKTILLDTNVLPECMSILKEAGHTIVGPMPGDTPERRAAFATANAIIIASAWQIDEAALAMAPHLQVVGRPGIGIDNVDTDACTRHGLCVVLSPDAPTQ